MTQTHGHSLWFTPRGGAGERFAQIIRSLSQVHQTPCFPPHITLLARVPQAQSQVVELARQLAQDCGFFEIELGEPATTRAYFQSLFIKAYTSKTLVRAHERALRLFGFPSQTGFMPHLSLLYGILPEAEKQIIIARLGRDFPVRFTAESIDVYLTKGPPKAWRLIASVPLLGPSNQKALSQSGEKGPGIRG
jgi:hypothetical protein